ncbi:hypothetical protein FJZ31_42305 [Candidatus Poribacteria bacterium]|nr:hypothetical protein [Candidatus Poribacteria bacterium]
MRQRKTSRTWRELVRRRRDKNAAEQRQQRSRRRERRRQAFATMKWRLNAVRDYCARRATCPEHAAAKQTASRFGVRVPTIRPPLIQNPTDKRRHEFRQSSGNA